MHTGHCLCGVVCFEVAGDFLHTYYCHCSRCRRATGSSFATNAWVRSEDLRVVQGDAWVGAYESLPGVFRHFCTRCGSPLFNRNQRVPQIRSLRLGVIDGDPGVRPKAHIFVGSKAPWFEITDGLPQHLESEIPEPSITPAEFAAERRFADTRFGRIAYVERGEGPVALFLHGAPLSGYQWRHQLAALSDLRRCIAPDLMSLGHTEIVADADVRCDTQADMLLAFLDTLGVERIDLIGNGSGGGIAQILAVKAPERIRSLVLSNCDAHDNWPPEQFLPMVELARQGRYGALIPSVRGQTQPFESAFERPAERAEALEVYLEPLLSTPERIANLERFVSSSDNAQTTRIRPQLEKLDVPTLVVWGTGDGIFAEQWADWLARTLPGACKVVKIPNAKVFFPEERPFETNTLIRRHWTELR